MKYIKFLIVIFLFAQVAKAQNSYQNQSKYWFYRYRLISEFLA